MIAAAWVLLLRSVIDVRSLYWPHYHGVFPGWPEWLICLRYAVSVTQRAAGATAGLGLLARRNWARRLALGLCAFIALTIPWKHPYDVVWNSFALYPDKKAEALRTLASLGAADPIAAFPIYVRALVVLFSLADLALVGWVAYALTRPAARQRSEA